MLFQSLILRTLTCALFLLLLFGGAASSPAWSQQKVIIDQDGGVDDFIALTLLLCHPEMEVKAITLAPADSYRNSAFAAMKKFVDYLGASNLTLAASQLEGTHLFPAFWRQDSDRVSELLLLKDVRPIDSNRVLSQDAVLHLVELLSGTEKYTLLETGPFSNLAEALRIKPEIRKNILRIYAMGGAVRVKGNVEEKGHDSSAEWNIYNNPEAAREVISSGIPITLVPLDATNAVPVNVRFLKRLEQTATPAAQLTRSTFQVIYDMVQQESYYFWDVLTAVTLLEPSLVHTEKLKIRVHTTSQGDLRSEGRTEISDQGTEIDVALKADQQTIENRIVQILGACRAPGK